MSKAMANWFSRTGSKSLPKETSSTSLVKLSTVHPSPEEESAKENVPIGNANNNVEIVGNVIEKSQLEVQLPADVQQVSFDSDEEEEEQEELAEDEAAANHHEFGRLELGPQLPLKEQLEKDKEDESLRRWKEQLLGSAASSCLSETIGGGDGGRFLLDPEVKLLRLAILTKGREELELPLLPPVAAALRNNTSFFSFCLKEGSRYQLKFVFTVRNNIVPGLTCINSVWKAGFPVDHTRSMLGTFAPQREPYIHIMPEKVTPSGLLARGAYTARKRFVDDDGTVYLDVNYSFEIRKDWY